MAFADQLEREGDAARAEFIRLQCAYDKLPEGEARIAATPPILAALARSPYLRSLRSLDLGLGQYSLNQIGPSGCKALAEAEALPQLRELELDFNEVTDEGWLAMVESGKLGRFTALRLQKCSLGDASLMPMFSGAPRLDELVTLDLSHNAMGPAGASALAALAPRSLRSLWLYGNPIGDAGVAALAKAPWLGQLRELNLDLVGMTDAGARALIESPHLDGIEQIVCELQKPALSKATIEALKARLGKRLNRPSIHSLRASQ